MTFENNSESSRPRNPRKNKTRDVQNSLWQDSTQLHIASRKDVDRTLIVNETFYSIQGESSYAGWPCAFIRLTGCNLACTYCDTTYAYEEGREISIGEITETIQSYQCPLVEVTGGEPMLQKNTPFLVECLLKEGFQVLLETNGSLDIRAVSPKCVRIVDFKCPSSGMVDANLYDNIDYLADHDEIKFVIADYVDFSFAKETLLRLAARTHRHHCVHFAPVFGQLAPRKLAEWILQEHVPARLQLQLHKIL
nr:radical SAM protein [Deltaproteobacteria bacterium]